MLTPTVPVPPSASVSAADPAAPAVPASPAAEAAPLVPSPPSIQAGGGPAPTDQLVQLLLQQQAQQQQQMQQLMQQLIQLQSQRQYPPAMQPSLPTFQGGGFNDAEFFWIRIKPYNKDIGCVRQRQFCDELGFTARGGSGAVGDIPQWYPVDPQIAQRLARYRQDPDNPNSPPVFDIVTPEEKEALDRYEEAHRMSSLGLGAPPVPQHSLQQALARGRGQAPLPQVRQPPSLLPAAAAAHQMAQQAAMMALTGHRPDAIQVIRAPQAPGQVQAPPALPPPAQLSPAQVAPAGRMAALQGLQAAPAAPGPAPASEPGRDLAAEAAASPEIGQLVQTSQAVAAQARAELGRDPMRPFVPRAR